MGLGIGLTMSPMSTAAMNAVDVTKAGLASGVLSMSRMVGGTFGVAAVGALFQHSATTGSRAASATSRSARSSRPGSPTTSAPATSRHTWRSSTPAPPAGRATRCRDTFVHSLSASLKLSTAVAAAGVVIALVMLRDARVPSAARCRRASPRRPTAELPRLDADQSRTGRNLEQGPIASAAAFEPRPRRYAVLAQADVKNVSQLDVEPGELPKTMTAWVIRQEREGEPKDAFQIEDIEVPEPGAFEVIVRVMAAGRELQQRVGGARRARVGVPLPPRGGPPHRRLGRLRRGVEGRRGRHEVEGRRRGRDPLQPGLLRGRRGARPRPAGRSLAEDLGLRDELGLVRPVHEGAGAAARAQAAEPDLGRGRLLRPHLLHRVPHADRPGRAAGRPQRADLGRGRRARRVRHAALQAHRRGLRRRRVVRREGRAGQAARREGLHQPQRVRGHDAQGRRVQGRGEGALRPVARVRQARQGDPRRGARHRVRARRPGDVPDLGVRRASRSARS